MTSVSLLDEELVLLDGHVNDKAQALVDEAKARIAMRAVLVDVDPRIAGFVADAVVEAQTNGRLIFRWTNVRYCPVCQKSFGYFAHKRTGRYHRKGEPNYDKPRYLRAIELAHRFISIQGSVTCGCCEDCWKIAQPLLAKALQDVRAEIARHITGQEPRFRRFSRRHCTKCNWRGHEGEMRPLDAIMGGQYPGGCPKCSAENNFLGSRKIETIDGFDVVAVEELIAK